MLTTIYLGVSCVGIAIVVTANEMKPNLEKKSQAERTRKLK